MNIYSAFDNFNMQEFLENKGYKLRKVNSENQFMLELCPFCGKEWHFGINFHEKVYGCYRCHSGGGYVQLLMQILGKNYGQVVEFLKPFIDNTRVDINYIGKLFNEVSGMENIEQKIKPIALPPGYISLHGTTMPYLEKRKVRQDQIDYYKMGFCMSGPYKNRVIICDVNDKQEVIYWVARDITGNVPKSKKLLNPSKDYSNGIGSGDLLFNWYLTKNYSCAIITEGVFDALWVGNNGLATYGYGLKSSHLYWLIRAGFRSVILLYDADVKDEDLEKSANLISQYIPTYICKLPFGDPDEHSKECLQKFISESKLFRNNRLEKLEIGF